MFLYRSKAKSGKEGRAIFFYHFPGIRKRRKPVRNALVYTRLEHAKSTHEEHKQMNNKNNNKKKHVSNKIKDNRQKRKNESANVL